MAQTHRSLKGYEVCVHTCVPDGCISRGTHTILWKREGHSCRKHACKRKVHPKCGTGVFADCPGRQFLGLQNHESGSRAPTESELAVVNEIPVLVHPFNESTSKTASHDDDDDSPMDCDFVPTFQYPSQPSSVRPFHIVFIPDPTLELKSKSAATNDLSFIHTQLSEMEYVSMKHLDGSVHSLSIIGKGIGPGRVPPRYRVCMQEWVGVFLFVWSSTRILTLNLFTAVYDDPPGSMARSSRRKQALHRLLHDLGNILQRYNGSGHTQERHSHA